MNSRRKEHDQQRAPAQDGQEWIWQPTSGEGCASALHELKRAERVKSSWRRMRSKPLDDLQH